MMIKSYISKEELENIIPQLKQLIKQKTKGTIVYSWFWILCATPLFIWILQSSFHRLIESGFQAKGEMFVIVLAILALIIDVGFIISMIFYPIFLKNLSKVDTLFEMEWNDIYKKSIRHVVVLENYIFIHSIHKMQTRYFILRNDDHLIFDELRRELVPRGKSKLKYKCFEDK